jgi:hypothetical protein
MSFTLISTKAEHSLGEIKNSSVCCCSIDLGTKLRLKKVNATFEEERGESLSLIRTISFPFLIQTEK